MTEDEEKYIIALAKLQIQANLLRIFIRIEGDLPVGVFGVTLKELATYQSILELSEDVCSIIDTTLEEV